MYLVGPLFAMVVFETGCHAMHVKHEWLYEDWRHATNDEMIKALKDHGHIASETVEKVMRTIDRRRFVERPIMNNPYWDVPQSLGYGSVMSSPKVHAQALEILKDYLKPGAHVLDIGSGSGYLTACMAHLVGPTGKVTGIEHIDELVARSNDTLHKYYPNLVQGGNVEFISADGRDGYSKGAPYDVIYVGGAVHYYPYKLISQLATGGHLLSSVGSYGEQSLTLYKNNGLLKKISAEVFGETKFMHLNLKERQLKAWEPIIKNKNYPKVDPIYVLIQKKIREAEGIQEDKDTEVHIPDMLRNWVIPQYKMKNLYKQA